MNGIVIVWCGACFRSGSPHIFSVTLLHLTLITSLMWLKPINTTARGQTPRDQRGSLFLTIGSMQWEKAGIASLKNILPIRPVKRLYPKTNRTSLCQHPMGSIKALPVLTLLKVCHLFLIIFSRIYAPLGIWVWRRTVPDAFFQGKLRLALTNLSN